LCHGQQITTEGAQMVAMVQGGVCSCTFDVEDDTDWHAGFIDKLTIFP